MAYPFVRALTFDEFAQELATNFGCVLRESRGVLSRANGEPPERVRYFERQYNGKVLQCAVVPSGDRLTPSVVRSICARLAIDPDFFGLTLG